MSNRKYTESHEWVTAEQDTATVGITDFAQNELGDIVYVEHPEPGTTVSKGDPLGMIESVKASSEYFSPVTGEIIQVNESLTDTPELVNQAPFGEGWLVKIRLSDSSELDSLLDEQAYKALQS